MSKITFMKLRGGQWGVRVLGTTVSEGEPVIVEKRGGSTTVVLGPIYWTGTDNESGEELSICGINKEATEIISPRPQRARRPRRAERRPRYIDPRTGQDLDGCFDDEDGDGTELDAARECKSPE